MKASFVKVCPKRGAVYSCSPYDQEEVLSSLRKKGISAVTEGHFFYIEDSGQALKALWVVRGERCE